MRTGRSSLARAAALALLASITTTPALAHASDMSGLAVIVVGMLLGIPAAVLLVFSIALSIAFSASRAHPRWHLVYAKVATVAAPLLGLAFPVVVGVFFEPKLFGASLFFDAPVVVLAIVSLVLARRLARRAQDSAIAVR